jgi:effector-binding domain-containing protein
MQGVCTMPGITVRQVDPATVLCLERRGPLSGMPCAFADLWGTLAATDLQPCGPFTTTYLDAETPFDPSDVRYKVCVAIPPQGEAAQIKPPAYVEQWPAGRVAVYVHRGPYEDLRTAYEILVRWISEQAYIITGPPREVYLTGPHRTDNPAEYVTEIHFPIESP